MLSLEQSMAKKRTYKYSPTVGISRKYNGGLSWDHQTSFYDTYDDWGYGNGYRPTDLRHDADDYDEDGNLKSAYSNYKSVPQNYGSYGSSDYSASSQWSSRFHHYDGGYYSSLSEEDKAVKIYEKELKTIGRSINSVRSVSGKLKREQQLEVHWTSSGQQNNVSGRNEIYLSPDPLNDHYTHKPDWTKDQRRDAVLGEAYTLVGMKRLTTPIVAKKIIHTFEDDRAKLEYEICDGWSGHRTDTHTLLKRSIAAILWKAIEQDAARSEVLKEYRGSKPYFAATQVYYSNESVKVEIEQAASVLDGLQLGDELLAGSSTIGASLLAWNINHSLDKNEIIDPPKNGDFYTHLEEAMNLLADAVCSFKTTVRWEKAMEAADVLILLEPNIAKPESPSECEDDEDGENEQKANQPLAKDDNPDVRQKVLEMLRDKLNGDQKTAFGDGENQTGASGKQEVENIEDDSTDGLSDGASHTQIHQIESIESYNKFLESRRGYRNYVVWDHHHFADAQLSKYNSETAHVVNRIKRKLDPISKRNYLPEHGLRRGRLTGSSLWKATTELPDNDRVFHRKQAQGVDRHLDIGLMIDFSSSMDGEALEIAKKCALIIKESLADFNNVNVLLFGHQSLSGPNTIYQFHDDLAFVALRANGGTNEGSGYAACAKAMINQCSRSSRKILFAIGDGMTGEDELRNCVQEAGNAGLETVDIFISSPDRGMYKNRSDDCFESASGIFGEANIARIYEVGLQEISQFYSVDHQATLKTANEEALAKRGSMQSQVLQIIEPWLTKLMSRMQRNAMIA